MLSLTVSCSLSKTSSGTGFHDINMFVPLSGFVFNIFDFEYGFDFNLSLSNLDSELVVVVAAIGKIEIEWERKKKFG